MFGIHLTCPACSFDMLTHWNHQGPGVTVVCADCGQQIDLSGRPDNEFDPTRDPCDVRLVAESPAAPEGVDVGPVIGTASIRAAILDESYGFIPTDIDLRCPACDSGNIVGGLAKGSRCPRCKTGSISHSGRAIY